MKLPLYLDYNATTPCDPRVMEVMTPYFTENFGNAASRDHSFGWHASEAVQYAREQVAGLIGAVSTEIIFTSGATEADNLALKGVFEMFRSKGNHIITSVVEHKAVLDTCRHLEKLGADVTYLKVNSEGLVDPEELEAAFKPTTILVAIMYANNETGTVMPVKKISAVTRKKGVFFFSDATQAVGKIPIDVNNDGIDLLAFSSHKMYGPKGAGALFLRRKDPRVKLTAQIDGGGHERGIRSGTLNVPGIAGFGKACELCKQEMKQEAKRLSAWRDKLETSLLKLKDTFVNGSTRFRLPHVTNISFNFVESEGLISGIQKDIAVSSGSACSSASREPSYVLKALGVADELARGSIRFSLGRFTTEEQIDFAIVKFIETINQLRTLNPYWKT
ncbi:MAG: IscS subfamily cysteine desulfurase [Sphingobacteriales bacterium UTBCD1]|nr:MAG: IscS subfamily cysteine desulfurase [Sphingobacteriales bacterium UTBCD1]